LGFAKFAQEVGFAQDTLPCKKMKSYISNYWSGSSVDNYKIQWQRWTKLTTPKGEGGMGFRDLPLFNKALLGK
jgi:hypothetical protein